MLISKIAIIQKIPNYVFNFPPFYRRKALNDAQTFPGMPLPMDNFTEVNFGKFALQMLIEGKTACQRTVADREFSLGGPPLGVKRASHSYYHSKLAKQAKKETEKRNTQSCSKTTADSVETPLPPPPPLNPFNESNYAVICHNPQPASSLLSSSERIQQASLSSEGGATISSDVSSVTSSIDTIAAGAGGAKPKFHYGDINEDMSLERWEALTTVEKRLASVWTFQSPFRVKILLAQYVNVKDVEKIYVAASVYHGSEKLCSTQTTRRNTPANPRWDEMLEFPDLLMQDIPLSAVLSLSMCAVTAKHKHQEEYATSYVNLQLFDYNRCMISGKFNMCMWSMPKGVEGVMNPAGLPGANPNRLTSSRILLEFDSFSKPIVYPPKSAVLQYARDVNQKERLFRTAVANYYREHQSFPQGHDDLVDVAEVQRNVDAQLKPFEVEEYSAFFERCAASKFYRTAERKWKAVMPMLEKAATQLDPFSQLSEQEKDYFWRERFNIRSLVPDALPKVLESCQWNFREGKLACLHSHFKFH